MSGIEWAPTLPDDWGGTSLRWLADIYAGGTPDKGNLPYWTGGTVPWLNSGSVNDWSIRKPSAWITEEAYASSSAKWIPAGAVVVALAGQGKTKGLAARLEISATCNQSMAAIVPGPHLEYRFLQFWLSANYQNIRNMAGGDKRDGLNLVHIGSVECPLPPLDEQRAIADYLDRETQQTNALIAEQRGLIETLRERRETIVDGLLGRFGVIPTSLDDRMADTLPDGWAMMLLGSTLKQLTNGFVGPTRDILVDDGVRYIQGTHIKNGAIDFGRRPFYVAREWHDARPRTHLLAGDVLIVQTGDIGKVAVVPEDFGEANCHALQIARAHCSIVDPWYLGAYLSSRFGYSQLKSRATGALHPHLEAGIRNAPVIVPPKPIQGEIAQEAAEQKRRIDALISESEALIALSLERRAALITAAVTGQIDVRKAT